MKNNRNSVEIIDRFSAKKPALIVSLTGISLLELETQYRRLPPEIDIIEWRVDKILQHSQISEVENIAKSLGNFIQQPILATVRTATEGGDIMLSSKEYLQVVDRLAEIEEIAIIDLELSEQNYREALSFRAQEMREKNIVNIFSKHFFDPEQSSKLLQQGMARILDEAFAYGADIAKLAIWINNIEDLLKLLQQTFTYHKLYPERKILLIGMGEVGRSSRLIGGIFGSCATFAANASGETQEIKLSSAPGQLPADLVYQVLQLLHG